MSSFTDHFLRINNLQEDFQSWHFQPGMAFGSPDLWWGQRKPRPCKHEGLDLAFYLDQHGQSRSLPASANFGPLIDGIVIKIFDDFLGKSILIHHPNYDQGQIYSIFGHTNPLPHLQAGCKVSMDKSIGSIANFTPKIHGPLPHLHLSFFKLSTDLSPLSLNWSMLSNSGKVLLVDPLKMLYTKFP